ncbi:GH1 family beta-glucosidase [Jannaschia sp. W003]|uniref:GH1 family beta-glucosidase n=1 Tax=Jannaschia sp. W003 TaxID=2867012 RepID=UPI0021A3E5C3|nr:GH1 family beta-glucosidase [Jannaschia sp. W003]UWQ20505.1 beta-glucosidase [Jannaschia sp. W003]
MKDTNPLPELSVGRADFPEGFRLSTATSAYQIEGHAFGGAGPTHWDTFASIPGKVAREEDGAVACDHYHRWEEDLDLIAAGNFDAYRFSTSWARVMPDGVTVNPEGLDFYDRLVDGMLERGIAPMGTLYHWELPEALNQRGGWLVRETPERFAEFTRVVAERIGDRLHAVAPINEPWCVAWLSHYHGFHAPGHASLEAGVRAMHHVALAHGLSAEVLHGMGQRGVGAACNFEYALPASDTDADRAAARLYDGIYNRWFVQAMTQGTYPEDVLEGFAPHMPEGWEADLATIRQPLDWFGVNYYTCQRLAAGAGDWPGYQPVPGPLPKTAMGWEICPEGLAYILKRLHGEFTGDVPLFITENGLANADQPGRPDRERIAYTDAHLHACLDAIRAGVPLAGYTAWSLMDNYEWTFGYEKRFGLVHVDFETQERTPKASYHALARAFARA